MRLAIISDVHGNLEALRCVRSHIERQSVDAVVNLGDCVTAPLWPRETLEELQALGATTVRGNHDRWLGDDERWKLSPTIAFTREQLSAVEIEELVALPPTAFLFDAVLAVHGTPASDTEYLLEDNIDGRLSYVTSATLGERLANTPGDVVLCGHSHQQQVAMAPGGRLVVNPGSVGCPRYAGNADYVRNEAGSPHARYAIATQSEGHWSVELFVLSYDWSRVAARARALGFHDWAASFLGGW